MIFKKKYGTLLKQDQDDLSNLEFNYETLVSNQ